MTQELDTEAPERRSTTVSSESSAETETELRIELAKLMIFAVIDADDEWPISPSDVLGPLTKAELVRCMLEPVEDAADEGKLREIRVRLRRARKEQVLAVVLSLCEENYAD